MYVPAVNVVISYDVDAMIEFGNTKDLDTFRTFIESREEQSKRDLGDKFARESFLFSNSPNSTFLSLEHHYGLKDGNSMSVELIDPQGSFEREMLDRSLSKQLDIRLDPIQQRLDKLQREKSLANNELARIKKEQNKLVFSTNDKAKQNLRELDQRRSKLEDRVDALVTQIEKNEEVDEDSAAHNKIVADQLKAYAGKMQRPVYITYGVGTNLQDWSPVQCYNNIVKIDYGFTGTGVRTLKLIFSGKSIHPNLTQSGLSPLGVNFNKGILATGISEFRLFNKEGTDVAIKNFIKTYKIKPEDRPIVEKTFNIKDPSIHWPVVEATEHFIKSATAYNNVLVLLPDLDYWLQKYLATQKNDVFTYSPPNLENVQDFDGINWKDLADSILGYTKALEGLGFSLCETDTGEDSNLPAAIGENAFEYIEECKSEDTITEWFTKNSYRVMLQTEIVNKTIQQKLSEVGDAINAKLKEYLVEDEVLITAFMNQIEIISDFELINILFDKGLITDNTRPVLVWGDRNIIDKVLYGRIFESTAKARARELDKEADAEKLSNASFADDQDLTKYVKESLEDYVNPMDQLRGFDTDYVRDVFDYFIPTSWVGPFGPQYSGANELDTIFPGDTNLEKASRDRQKNNPLLAARLPLFSFGNSNPNILQVNIELSKQYLAALASVTPVAQQAFGRVSGLIPKDFESEAFRIFTKIKNFDLNDVDEKTGAPKGFEKLMDKYYDYDWPSGDDLQNFDQWEEIFNQLEGHGDTYKNMTDKSFYGDWIGGEGLTSKQHFMRFMWKAFSALYKEGFDPKPTMQKSSSSKDPAKASMIESVALAQTINQTALQGKIKTIPMFALSSPRRVISKACVIHCVEPRIHNPNDPNENLKGNTAWFSGIYDMLGFKHTITNSDAHSEFFVARPGNRGLVSQEEDSDK